MNRRWVIDLTLAEYLRASTDDGRTVVHVFRNGDVWFDSPTTRRGPICIDDADEMIGILQDAKQMRWEEYRQPEPIATIPLNDAKTGRHATIGHDVALSDVEQETDAQEAKS